MLLQTGRKAAPLESDLVLLEERRSPLDDHLYYFRPGEEARMLARCQFGLKRDGRCGATLTYPIKGFPWRRNPTRSIECAITQGEADKLFEEVATMPTNFPAACLGQAALYSDQTEKASGITRRVSSGKLCYTLGIYSESGVSIVYYSMEEDCEALRGSRVYNVVRELIAPHETL